jgi:GH24 family phage-related lysozyme (muramidase)
MAMFDGIGQNDPNNLTSTPMRYATKQQIAMAQELANSLGKASSGQHIGHWTQGVAEIINALGAGGWNNVANNLATRQARDFGQANSDVLFGKNGPQSESQDQSQGSPVADLVSKQANAPQANSTADIQTGSITPPSTTATNAQATGGNPTDYYRDLVKHSENDDLASGKTTGDISKWDNKQYTYGFGSRAPGKGVPIDAATAHRVFDTRDWPQALAQVEQFKPGLDPGTKSALASLTYNTGTKWMNSGLGQSIQKGNLDEASSRFLQYIHSNNPRDTNGLKARRAQEVGWFGQQPPNQTTQNAPQANAPYPASQLHPRKVQTQSITPNATQDEKMQLGMGMPDADTGRTMREAPALSGFARGDKGDLARFSRFTPPGTTSTFSDVPRDAGDYKSAYSDWRPEQTTENSSYTPGTGPRGGVSPTSPEAARIAEQFAGTKPDAQLNDDSSAIYPREKHTMMYLGKGVDDEDLDIHKTPTGQQIAQNGPGLANPSSPSNAGQSQLPGYNGPMPSVAHVPGPEEMHRLLMSPLVAGDPEMSMKIMDKWRAMAAPQDRAVTGGTLQTTPGYNDQHQSQFFPTPTETPFSAGSIHLRTRPQFDEKGNLQNVPVTPGLAGPSSNPGQDPLAGVAPILKNVQRLEREGALNSDILKENAGPRGEFAKQAIASANSVRTLHEMKGITSLLSIDRGPTGDTMIKLKEAMDNHSPGLFNSLGFDREGVKGGEMMQKLNSYFAAEATKAFNSRGTNFDLQTFMRTFPGIMQSAKGTDALIDLLEQEYSAKRDIGLKVAHLKAEDIEKDPTAVNKIMEEHYKNNPIKMKLGDKTFVAQTFDNPEEADKLGKGNYFLYKDSQTGQLKPGRVP